MLNSHNELKETTINIAQWQLLFILQPTIKLPYKYRSVSGLCYFQFTRVMLCISYTIQLCPPQALSIHAYQSNCSFLVTVMYYVMIMNVHFTEASELFQQF